MDPRIIVISAASLGSVGVASAVLLAGASKFFKVEQDPRIDDLLAVLPGANCGGCGFPGCGGFAAALIDGRADVAACAPGGAEVARRIGTILGCEVSARVRSVVRLRCRGHVDTAVARITYAGVDSCRALLLVAPAGAKTCPRGCEGLGDCVRVCVFGALTMGDNGLPIIDEGKCTACGQCVSACPKGVLAMEPHASTVYVGCSTELTPKEARQACGAACIGCRLCLKACPYDALAWDGRRPVRHDETCVGCGLCVDACKPGVLVHARGTAPEPGVRAAAELLGAERRAAEVARKAAAKAAAAVSAESAASPPERA